jgi:predicted phage terminase large subunit-like protein
MASPLSSSPLPPFKELVQSWDTATKLGANNDYSACTTWGIHENTYYLLDAYRARWEFPELLRTVGAQAELRQVQTVLIEDANSGAALIQSLRRTSRLNIIAVKPTLDKMTRAAQQSAAFEAGRVLLPEAAPWLVDFERELLAFPNGRYDDQLDSAVQFLNWAAARVLHQVPIFMPDILIIPRSDPLWDIPPYW